MSTPQTVAEILREHVTLEVESIDRMYLNVYIPQLHERGVVAFFRYPRGQTFTSSALMAPISQAFVAAIKAFVQEHHIPLITFPKGQRKDEISVTWSGQHASRLGCVFQQERVWRWHCVKRASLCFWALFFTKRLERGYSR